MTWSGTLEDLKSISSHLVTALVNDIESLKTEAGIAALESDIDKVRALFLEMTDIWIKLEPAQAIAQELFPQLAPIFAVLNEIATFDQKLLTIAQQ